MTTVTVDIARDPEASQFWLARFAFSGRDYTTQGYSIEEARSMAGELLRQEGACDDTMVRLEIHDEAPLSMLRTTAGAGRRGLPGR
jgi:hypothetical protein